MEIKINEYVRYQQEAFFNISKISTKIRKSTIYYPNMTEKKTILVSIDVRMTAET